MNFRPFGRTTSMVSRLGFGGWQLGNSALWTEMTEEEGVTLVKKAIEKGINFFDAAPGYSNGLSEIIIGKAIEGIREKVIINTKFGHSVTGEINFSEDAIEPAIMDSLKRLKTTYLDSLILHNPDIDILSNKTNHFKVLKEMKAKGLIRAYGVSIDTYDQFKTVLEKTDCDVIEILFNVFFQAPAQLFSFAKAKKITLIAKVPLDSGWLTGKFDSSSTFTGIRDRWSKEAIIKRSIMVEKLKKLTSDNDITKYSLAFLYSFDAITTVIPGMSSIKQLEQNISYLDYELPYHMKQTMIELYNTQIKNNPLPW